MTNNCVLNTRKAYQYNWNWWKGLVTRRLKVLDAQRFTYADEIESQQSNNPKNWNIVFQYERKKKEQLPTKRTKQGVPQIYQEKEYHLNGGHRVKKLLAVDTV